MNSKSLTVIAQVKASPGKEAEVRMELLSLIAPSRKDHGCLNAWNRHNHRLISVHERRLAV